MIPAAHLKEALTLQVPLDYFVRPMMGDSLLAWPPLDTRMPTLSTPTLDRTRFYRSIFVLTVVPISSLIL